MIIGMLFPGVIAYLIRLRCSCNIHHTVLLAPVLSDILLHLVADESKKQSAKYCCDEYYAGCQFVCRGYIGEEDYFKKKEKACCSENEADDFASVVEHT